MTSRSKLCPAPTTSGGSIRWLALRAGFRVRRAGFGVSSDIDWDLFGGIGYEVSDRISLVGGYRGIGVDYSSGGFVFDVIEHGPILGGVFRF